MKVLYITHPEADYGGSYLYNGLCKIIGAENVIDFPCKHSYHGQEHRYAIRNLPNGMTCPPGWMRAWPYPYPVDEIDSEQYVLQQFSEKQIAFVVVESPREVAKEVLHRMARTIKDSKVPLVVHDGEDYPQLDKTFTKYLPALYLKRELLKNKYPREDFVNADGVRIVSFPFSCPLEEMEAITGNQGMPRDNFTLDLFFSAGATWEMREEVARALRGLDGNVKSYVALSPDYDRSSGIPMLSWPEYVTQMARSRMCVSVRGFGYDTCRYWEVAASSVLVAHPLQIHIPNPYEHGNTCLVYENAEDCVRVVTEWAQRYDELDAIARRGYEHTKAYHTDVARARKLLELIG